MKIDTKEWLSLKEASKLLGTSPQYCWQMGKQNRITVVRYFGIDLYSVKDIEKYKTAS